MILAVWLLSLPFRLLATLGLRRSVILACLLVLAVTAYGVTEDLGLIELPAKAAPAPKPKSAAGQPRPSRAAAADIPVRYLRLYRTAAARYRIPWPVLAAIGKVESDHGRSPLPGVRSGWNVAGAAGPMQFGIGVGRAGNAWARFGRDYDGDGRRSVYDPGDAIPAAARYLCAAGTPRHLDQAIYAYNHSWAYVAKVKAIARRYTSPGGGRR
jgi:membrane-bound lytic murein transglycosylase B